MDHNLDNKEYITGEDDFVLLKKGDEYMSGGFYIPSLITTYNINNNDSDKNIQVSQIFQDLAVPSGLFFLQENKVMQKKYLYSKGGYEEDSSSSSSEEEEEEELTGGKKNDVVSDDLFDKLLHLVKQNKNQKNKSKKNKNKIHKKRSISKKIIK
jgi:hypothetical protein